MTALGSSDFTVRQTRRVDTRTHRVDTRTRRIGLRNTRSGAHQQHQHSTPLRTRQLVSKLKTGNRSGPTHKSRLGNVNRNRLPTRGQPVSRLRTHMTNATIIRREGIHELLLAESHKIHVWRVHALSKTSVCGLGLGT